MRLDKLATYISRCASPVRRRGIFERMYDFELVRMRALERGELVPEQDIRFGVLAYNSVKRVWFVGSLRACLRSWYRGVIPDPPPMSATSSNSFATPADGRSGQVA